MGDSSLFMTAGGISEDSNCWACMASLTTGNGAVCDAVLRPHRALLGHSRGAGGHTCTDPVSLGRPTAGHVDLAAEISCAGCKIEVCRPLAPLGAVGAQWEPSGLSAPPVSDLPTTPAVGG